MTGPSLPAVGIDLGTTFSAIAHLDSQGRPTTITNSEGELTTPSVLFFDHDDVIVGTEASIAGQIETERMAKLAKRDMGGAHYSKKILGRQLPPEVIQSFILQRLKSDAEMKIGPFQKAVVTVPAYFDEPRRKATQDAGAIAGIDVIEIINEPTAAALAYGVQQGFLNEQGQAIDNEIVMVYDLGGGTFDVTLMSINGKKFTAIGTGGDVFLGGFDWDQRIFDHVSKTFLNDHQIDCSSDPALAEKLMLECNRAKKTLSTRTEATIRIEHNGKPLKIGLTRKQFEDISNDLVERTRLTCERVLRDTNLKWTDVTRLLLVGGSTRMPMIPAMLESASGLTVDRSLSPDESVAHGAAIYAGILLKHGSSIKGISVKNISSHDLGVLGFDPKTKEPRRKVIIPRNQPLPVKSAKKFQTSKEDQKRVLVQIVEGGTDTGLGATNIGNCAVEDLPAGLPKGTPVIVTFNYDVSGRLDVQAKIPSLEKSASSSIERARGMDQSQIEEWKSRIANGIMAEALVATAAKPASPTSDLDSPVSDTPVFEQVEVVETVETVETAESPGLSAPTITDSHPERATQPHFSSSRIEINSDDYAPTAIAPDESALGDFFEIESTEPLAGESVLNFLDNDEPAKGANDSALNNFFDNLE